MSTISASTTSTTAYKVTADTTGTLVLQTGSGPTTALTIDTSQNLGLGVTPSAWRTVYKALQTNGGSVYGFTSNDRIGMVQNGYVDATSLAWTYVTTSAASRYDQIGGVHAWYTAASGTAGNAISFTQAMTLDASGRLGIGTTSPASPLHVVGDSSLGGTNTYLGAGTVFQEQRLTVVGSTSGSTGLSFNQWTGAAYAERMRINSSGALCVGTTGLSNNGNAASFYGAGPAVRIYGTTEASGALAIDKSSATTTTAQQFINFTINNQGTGSGQINANGASQAAFGSFSDERLKENIVDLPPQLSNILALRPVEFDYKAGGHQTGFIAQEMQQVFPDAVCEDGSEENYLTITGWNKTEAILVKAIQEQQALIQTLTERITALENK